MPVMLATVAGVSDISVKNTSIYATLNIHRGASLIGTKVKEKVLQRGISKNQRFAVDGDRYVVTCWTTRPH
jgi:hypothetical protein